MQGYSQFSLLTPPSMSYCLNPGCHHPQNSGQSKFCQFCGDRLLLSDRYRPIRAIAQGGFGRTFLASDEYKPSKPHCVIKQFFPHEQGTRDPRKAAELFFQEAVRLEELGHHPQIPELLAYFEQDQRQYLVQEWVDGPTLEQELRQKGVFTEGDVYQLLNNLLPVLQFVHDHQVIHRDIKPTNIIRRLSNNQLVLVDFGAAKVTTNTDLFRTGTSIGSPAYVAPEQAMGKAIFASDLYSLGVTCIYLLTRVHPTELFDPEEGVWAWRSYVNAAVEESFGKILDKLLAGPTGRRYRSASDVLQDLRQVGDSSARAIAPPTAPLPPQAAAFSPAQTSTRSNPAPQWRCVHTLSGHSHWVRSVAITPDGQTVISGSGDKTIKLWNLQTGLLRQTLIGHSHWVRSVAISTNGQTLASASNDKTVKIWRLGTNEALLTLTGHSDWVRTVTLDPNGQRLVSGSQDTTLKLWHLPTGELIQTLTGHQHWVLATAMSADGQQLVSGSRDQTIKLWDLRSRSLLHTFAGHRDAVNTVAISADQRLLVSGSQDRTIKLWRLDTGELLHTLTDHTDAVNSVTISADSKTLISASQDKTIRVWRLDTGELLHTLTEHAHWIWSIAISVDGQTLVSGCADGTIKVWRCDS